MAFKAMKSLRCLLVFNIQNVGTLSSGIIIRNCSGIYTRRDEKKKISHTNMIMQDGSSILELPCIAQIINGDFQVHNAGTLESGAKFEGMCIEYPLVPKKPVKKISNNEEKDMIKGFKKCLSIKRLFHLLQTCPEDEVTPLVALVGMRRMFQLESNIHYRNKNANQYPPESSITFAKKALLKSFVEKICDSTDNQIIVDGLRVISLHSSGNEQPDCVEQLSTEVSILAANGNLTVHQVCHAIQSFYCLKTIGEKYLDKVWVGINDGNTMRKDELLRIINVLPLVKKSRRYLYSIVERKIVLVWHEMDLDDVIRFFQLLTHFNELNRRLLPMLCKWVSLNIHTMREGSLRWIVLSLLALDFTSPEIQKAINRYMRAKGGKIQDPSVVAGISDYFCKLRIRHTAVLDLVARYYVENAGKFSPSDTTAVVKSLGYLNYTPPNATEFFQIVESQINDDFAKFSPSMALTICLSCMFLEHYPVGIVDKIFNPFFLYNINALDIKDRLYCHTKLKWLDSSLYIDVPDYKGPFLAKQEANKDVNIDYRIIRLIDKIRTPLLSLLEGDGEIMESVLLPTLPADVIYVIDIVLTPNSDFKLGSDQLYALLIHVPEHYDITGTVLVGPQAMRVRHLIASGLTVVNLDYLTLNNLSANPNMMIDYIKEEMKRVDHVNES